MEVWLLTHMDSEWRTCVRVRYREILPENLTTLLKNQFLQSHIWYWWCYGDFEKIWIVVAMSGGERQGER